MSDPAGYSYPEDAACAGHPFPWLFDEHLPGETVENKRLRHGAALVVCGRCPVIEPCRELIDPRHDEGIKGGLHLGRSDDPRRRVA